MVRRGEVLAGMGIRLFEHEAHNLRQNQCSRHNPDSLSEMCLFFLRYAIADETLTNTMNDTTVDDDAVKVERSLMRLLLLLAW